MIGPVFAREVAVTPRRPRLYVYRAVYVAALFLLICTAWQIMWGTQVIRNVGDMARFGSLLFQVLAPLQLILLIFFAAFSSAAAVAQEKDRRTLILLLMTRLNNFELVLGKLLASLLPVLVMLSAAVPLFCLVVLFGGVSFVQVLRVFAVTTAAVLAAGSLGSTMALWREKTFQTLALTALILVAWMGAWAAVSAAGGQIEVGGRTLSDWAVAFDPIQAVLVAAQPWSAEKGGGPGWQVIAMFLFVALAVAVMLNAWAAWRVRVWNPSREIQSGGGRDEGQAESIWGAEYDVAQESGSTKQSQPAAGQGGVVATAELARAGHVDARLRRHRQDMRTREVWDNPVLWREIRTWAYGHKVLLSQFAYLLLTAGIAVGLYAVAGGGSAANFDAELAARIPAAAKLLAPFFLVSLVIINSSAVTSVTSERDNLTLDVLLATDISAKEFVFGKLLGVTWVTKLMVLAPVLLCIGLWAAGGIGLEEVCYVVGGLLVLDLFVAVLGIHCGMTYANSRTAIGVSLGTVFFLFVGVVTCLLMIISFSGSFNGQLAPFLAFILGGGVGLYVALGVRNPSTAIGVASMLVPFATFYAITSFVLQYTLSVFLVTVAAYGFTTAALLIPAVYEFDVEMGRTSRAQE